MDILRDLLAFFGSVLSHWVALGAGVVGLLTFLYERCLSVELSWRRTRAVFVWGCLLVAVFWAWQEEHAKVAQLGRDLAQAKQSRAWIGVTRMSLQEMRDPEPIRVAISIHN